MISFIVVAKNEESYIGSCLASIFMQQTPEPFEVIVVDNGSTDNTQAVITKDYPQVKIIQEAKPGTNSARQKGFLESKGDILIFLDADVRLPNGRWLKKLLGKFKSPKVVGVSSHYKYYDTPWHLRLLQQFGTFVFVYPWIFLLNNVFHYSAHMVGGLMAIKRQALEMSGGFDLNTQFFGDEALIVKRLYKLGTIRVSPKLWALTSGRRFKKQGLFHSVFNYVLNYFFVLLKGKPYEKKGYREFR